MGIETGEETCVIPQLTRALTYRHILLSYALMHPLKEHLLSFPLLFSYSDLRESLTFPLNDPPLNTEQLSVPAGGNIVPLLVS